MSNEERLNQLIEELGAIIKDLGVATAYGYAVEKGYEGTEEEFAELMADYAHVAQDAEAAAQAAAESATAAHNSEVNAAASEGEAEQAKLDAQASAQAADVSEANAKISELNADTHAENAEAIAVGTRGGVPVGQGDPAYHNNAKYYAELADTKADQAADSADTAATKAGEASTSAATAGQKATEASASAADADASKTAAKTSEDNAKASETTASNAAVSAMNSRDSAAGSATTASNAASTATQKATEAGQSATSAAGSASTATQKATEASQSATSASGSASTATQKATEASNSANAAAQSAADAAESATHVADMALMQAIAPKYDSTAQYKVGNLLTYLGKQYYCIADAPAGTLPTNTTYFEEKSVADIIEMIKNGSIVVGHSDVADNLTPYSEDSGTTQENPFISQGTGTDNNSVIVTTGTIARQLEKQGNTIVVNQRFGSTTSWTRTSNGVTVSFDATTGLLTVNGTATGIVQIYESSIVGRAVKGHRTWCSMRQVSGTQENANPRIMMAGNGNYSFNLNNTPRVLNYTETGSEQPSFQFFINNGGVCTNLVLEIKCFDIESWNSSIITDLTANPSHFSWYYNGSLAYDAGSLKNCNGRYLECGQWRNLFDQQTELGTYSTTTGEKVSGNSNIRCKSPILVIPNKPLYFFNGSTGGFRVLEYDKDGTFIKSTSNPTNNILTTTPNTQYITFFMASTYGTTYKNDISIELYYTPAEGGEGYGEMHDYIAPIRIDTGNETLLAFDKKLPSGVIERNTGEVDLGTLDWGYDGTILYVNNAFNDSTLAKFVSNSTRFNCISIVGCGIPFADVYSPVVGFCVSSNGKNLYATGMGYTSGASFKTAMSGVMLQYELAEPTTEQGSPFSEYAPINDYSYMAWFDTDGNLVSIPQGCKLFYPVDYKGFTDDLVMYTNGDATALAKGEDITDAALNARGYYKMQDLLTTFGANGMVGGTLRQTLANKATVDFLDTDCVDLGTLTWTKSNTIFYATLSAKKDGDYEMICSKYKYQKNGGFGTSANCIGDSGNSSYLKLVIVNDSTYANLDATAFKEAMQGVLLAFQKAST